MRVPVLSLSIIHKALSADSHDAAVAWYRRLRASGHFYYIADAAGNATALECTGTRLHQQTVEQGVYVHCNHCLIAENAALEGNELTASPWSGRRDWIGYFARIQAIIRSIRRKPS